MHTVNSFIFTLFFVSGAPLEVRQFGFGLHYIWALTVIGLIFGFTAARNLVPFQ
jgi:hypothetical protein